MKTVILAGFGAFEYVVDNPSAAVAEALDGCVLGGVSIFGREMPVSYQRSVDVCQMWLESTRAVAVVGIGVAVSRTHVTVERMAKRPSGTLKEDVDGCTTVGCTPEMPSALQATANVERLATLLGASVGDDAGDYVCNAWLYQAIQRFHVDVGFIHVPPNGLDTGKLLYALSELWGESGG
jgi:pyrrolidone-carboxylate peptidase